MESTNIEENDKEVTFIVQERPQTASANRNPNEVEKRQRPMTAHTRSENLIDINSLPKHIQAQLKSVKSNASTLNFSKTERSASPVSMRLYGDHKAREDKIAELHKKYYKDLFGTKTRREDFD